MYRTDRLKKKRPPSSRSHQPLALRVQPEGRRAADGADPVPPVRDGAYVRAGGGKPEATEVFLERSVDLPGLQLLALRLLHVQLGLFRDLLVVS